jgi:hypothetical protein
VVRSDVLAGDYANDYGVNAPRIKDVYREDEREEERERYIVNRCIRAAQYAACQCKRIEQAANDIQDFEKVVDQ